MKYFFTTLVRNTILLVVMFISFQVFSQETGISPYSRLGIGTINRSHSPAYNTMGGASIGLSDFNLINVSNPASYSSFMKHIPIFEVDGSTEILNLKSSTSEGTLAATTFTKIAMGLPLSERLGVSIGLIPYTTTGYDIISNSTITNVGEVSYLFQGKGGVNKVYLGSGYELIDKDSISLSLGFNANFLFGRIEESRRVEFPDDNTALNSLISQSTNHNGFNFDLGLLYKQMMSKSFSFSIGANFNAGGNLNASRDQLSATYTNFNSVQVIRDTISFGEDNEGTVRIPMSFTLGGSLNFNKNLDIAFQYQAQDWTDFKEDFTIPTTQDSLASSNYFSVGIRYTPVNPFEATKYYQSIQYRAGFRYGNSPLQFNNIAIQEFGTSFGLGIPIRKSASNKGEFKSLSMINIGVEVGKRGTTEAGLIQENFTNIYFGISIMPQAQNRWFVKRKFN
ncbi:MAG: hypothetical protein P8N07_07350 [Flavobacteriales bacterium]|nr:hypothetical protein [Flavobacteriales bacterium]